MALRLTGPDAARAGRRPSSHRPPARTLTLPARAGALLGRRRPRRATGRSSARSPAGSDAAERDLRPPAARRGRARGCARAPSPALAGRLAAVAAEVVALLEDDPREPWLLNHAGVALYELGEIRAAEALFTRARAGSTPSCPTSSATSPSARAAAAPAPRRRRACRPPSWPSCATSARAPSASPPRARPATGLTLSLCMIVKDEEAMIGRCLASVRDAVDEIVVVDTGSSDRTVEIAEALRRDASCTTSGRATSPRPATSPSTPPRATGSSTSTPTRSSSTATPRRLRALPARPGARRSSSSRPTTPASSRTAPRPRTTRCASSATAPSYRFAGPHPRADHRHAAERAARAHRAHRRAPGALRLPRRRPRRQGQVAAQHRAARAPDRRGRGLAVPALQPRLRAHGRRRRTPRRSEHLREAWDGLTPDGEVLLAGFAPSLATRLMTRAARLRRARRGRRTSPRSPCAPSRASPTSSTSRPRPPARAGDDDARRRAARAVPGDGATRRARYSPHVGCGTHLAALVAGRDPRRRGRPAGRRGAAAQLAWTSSPASRRASRRSPACCCARAARSPRCSAEVEALSGGDLRAVRALPASPSPLYEAGAVVEAEGMLREIVAAQPARRPGARGARRGAAVAGPPARTPPSGRRGRRGAGRRQGAPRCAPSCSPASPRAPTPATAPSATALAAAEGRLPAAERAALAAWAGAERRRPAARPPRRRVLELMLDVLARLEDFEAFERLAAVLDRIAIPERDRRERLAQVYLRRGYLESAADEWIGVCDRLGADAARPARPGRGRRAARPRRGRRAAAPRVRAARGLVPRHVDTGRRGRRASEAIPGRADDRGPSDAPSGPWKGRRIRQGGHRHELRGTTRRTPPGPMTPPAGSPAARADEVARGALRARSTSSSARAGRATPFRRRP